MSEENSGFIYFKLGCNAWPLSGHFMGVVVTLKPTKRPSGLKSGVAFQLGCVLLSSIYDRLNSI